MRRNRILSTSLVTVLLCLGVQAQDTQQASREDVLKFMDVLQLRQRLTQYFEGVAKQAKLGAEEGFRQKVSNPTPEQIATVDKFAESLFKDMGVDEMLNAMVPIYQKHLTKTDLESILAFYGSPAGKKLLQEQPAMMQEAMEVGGEIGRKRIGVMVKKMEEFTADLAKQEQQKDVK